MKTQSERPQPELSQELYNLDSEATNFSPNYQLSIGQTVPRACELSRARKYNVVHVHVEGHAASKRPACGRSPKLKGFDCVHAQRAYAMIASTFAGYPENLPNLNAK